MFSSAKLSEQGIKTGNKLCLKLFVTSSDCGFRVHNVSENFRCRDGGTSVITFDESVLEPVYLPFQTNLPSKPLCTSDHRSQPCRGEFVLLPLSKIPF